MDPTTPAEDESTIVVAPITREEEDVGLQKDSNGNFPELPKKSIGPRKNYGLMP